MTPGRSRFHTLGHPATASIRCQRPGTATQTGIQAYSYLVGVLHCEGIGTLRLTRPRRAVPAATDSRSPATHRAAMSEAPRGKPRGIFSAA